MRTKRGYLSTRFASAASLLLVAALAQGCSARSAEVVTSMSIAPRPPGSNLLDDGDFEQPGLGAWTSNSIPNVSISSDRRIRYGGAQSLRLTASHAQVTRSTVVEQEVTALPDTEPGARYVLRVFVRTKHLNRRVQIELKLIYGGGGYEFFSGRAAGRRRLGIPRGTPRGWVPVVVRATARFPVEAIDVFVVDTGPGPLDGSIWLDSADLRRRR